MLKLLLPPGHRHKRPEYPDCTSTVFCREGGPELALRQENRGQAGRQDLAPFLSVGLLPAAVTLTSIAAHRLLTQRGLARDEAILSAKDNT